MDNDLIPLGTIFIFDSPYMYGPDNLPYLKDREGFEAEIIGHITAPNDDIDEECLPMYRIRFLSDSLEIDAWPEEVEDHKIVYRR